MTLPGNSCQSVHWHIIISKSCFLTICSVAASSIAWQKTFGITSIGNSTAVHVFVGGFYGLNSVLLLIKCMQVLLNYIRDECGIWQTPELLSRTACGDRNHA